ncbi:cardiolipin synthase [Solitalea koreensis]|uniref:Cardiolipin synthase n=1 Tax=Solitalea koreensis TaxID=543615 RepID=A0A521DS09_9SPHI|nr:cardiolipin synthase [Solitalea koreensis]SMO74408.1 cardiolipin synthase [Solitalea koreensis]
MLLEINISEVVLNTYLLIIYMFAVVVAARILLENRNPAKTVAYLLLLLFIPFVGIIVYIFFGLNYRKKRLYKRKLKADTELFGYVRKQIVKESEQVMAEHSEWMKGRESIVRLLLNDSLAKLTSDNQIDLLINGEEKFPAVFAAMEAAEKFIHLEYFIFENDKIGHEIKELLIRKSKAGVTVRFIYDDYGSRHLHSNFINELKAAGIRVFPFYRIYFPLLANRINYRDHRKIIVVDGKVGFIGGINVSDRYINLRRKHRKGKKGLYWRDSHIRIEGSAVQGLQYLFISNWNFCSEEDLQLTNHLFPQQTGHGNELVQIASSGPDSKHSTIMMSFVAAINSAIRSIYITTPYFIPNDALIDCLKRAAICGLDIQLLIPGITDTLLVNAAARSFYEELMEVGVRIFTYQKGFVHAKTVVIDDNLSIIGTANMDVRSFDCNFEVNAVVYGTDLNLKLTNSFKNDLLNSKELDLATWRQRSRWKKLGESIARLLAPLL